MNRPESVADLTPQQRTVLRCYSLAAIALRIAPELEAAILEYRRADDFGALFDPTAWMQSKDPRDEDSSVLAAVLELVKSLKRSAPPEKLERLVSNGEHTDVMTLVHINAHEMLEVADGD